ncbi:MAG TPA: UDP-N-acetylmuramoyl-L-alanyl-D-glutamate--2,6-diaminopimelate ligase [Balneolaceae bacterium]|nr:UDP-N-acetylmuramoyl-L-alanyl-D-glutamate--2,6-diaminopimelate ligase [Balneolaceae bacterium]
MTIERLIEFCDPSRVEGECRRPLGKLCQDSREIEPGDLFIAVKGVKSDGHNFIDEAVKRGAAAIMVQDEIEASPDICVITVKKTKKLLGPLAQFFAGNPAEKLTVIGVTGTNGKTTVATLIWQVLTKLGVQASLLGTVEKRILNESLQSRLTTADPIELAADMKRMVEAGSTHLVMEVSSHALDQKRVKGIPFDAAVFTNLSHDHLDYHPSFNDYASSKKKLFNGLDSTSWAITNADDSRGEWIVNSTPANVISVSLKDKGLMRGELKKSDASGLSILIDGTRIDSPLVGRFNAYNVIEALFACTALGFDGAHVATLLSECNGAPGRMERVSSSRISDQTPTIFVDYAHTPDALDNVASTIKEFKKKRQKLTVVFGCGGDRDRKKRPVMAQISEKYADRIIVTSDNPRTEDPDSVIDEIITGFSENASYTRIVSRREAIEHSIKTAGKNDIILIAGKGHETYQEVNGVRSHFDDREIARDALNVLKSAKPTGEAG